LLALGEVTAIAETEATAKAATTASEGNIGDERTWGKGAGLRLVGGKNYFVRSDGRHTFSQRQLVTAATTPLLYLVGFLLVSVRKVKGAPKVVVIASADV
jgi:hypothetical protein